jgi:hypothetical protein
MNSYSLAADSHHWWWLPALTGVIGTAAVSAILVVPATGEVAPLEPPPAGIGGAASTGSVIEVERPCYLARPEWNTPRGWEHPVCTTVLRGQGGDLGRYHARPAPDALP